MKKLNPILQSFIYSAITVVYVALVVLVMSSGSKLFISNGILTGVAMLLLFVLSALVVGSLVLGKPVMMYWDGKKKDALIMLFYNAGWLFLWLAAILLGMFLLK